MEIFTLLRIYFWFEFFALVMCIISFNKLRGLRYKAFLFYLGVIVLFELSAIYRMFSIPGNNMMELNGEFTFEFIFWGLFILSGYKNKPQRNRLGWAWLGIFVFTIVDIFLIQGIHKLCTYAILVQYSLLIVLVCHFFYRKMQEFDVSESLLRQPDFWVHTGLLFYFLCQFLFFAAFTSLAYKKIPQFGLLASVIVDASIIILYSCLGVAFLCFRRTTQSS